MFDSDHQIDQPSAFLLPWKWGEVMARIIDWEKDRKLTQRNIHGVDLAVDAAHDLESVSEIHWDPDGSWWVNRRLLADRTYDLVQNLGVILRKWDQHYLFNAAIVSLHAAKHSQDLASCNSMKFEKWLKTYQNELSLLAGDWKSMKLDIAFTYTKQTQLAEQKKLFKELLSRTPWQLEQMASII